MISFQHRSLQKEELDLYSPPLEEIRKIYSLIELVNRYLGGASALLFHFEEWAKVWPSGRIISILDVAAGGGDLVKSLFVWAKARGLKIHITLLDFNSEVLQTARENLKDFQNVRFLQGSAFELPFEEKSFDYVISSMFFHHISDEEIPALLKKFDSVCRRGILLNDLLRHPLAYAGISILAAFARNAVFKNDAPLSVLRGFSKPEILKFKKQSGLEYLNYREHWAFRFTLAGEKYGSL